MISWNVWRYNFNEKRIEEYNIFTHKEFRTDCQVIARKWGRNRKEFEERILHSLVFYFWSKCEYEVILSGWPPTKDGSEARKVDVRDQVLLNTTPFLDYLWKHKDELKRCGT